MANHKSAIKRIRTNEKRRLANRSFRSRTRTLVKKARKQLRVIATNASALPAAEAAMIDAVRDLDKAASRGVVHPRNAARRKSRLMKQLAALKAAQS
ncbi:MAG: 30S ribosomal protein S20 [Armatimonadetes bacterium]|nr:30S ribosomal protein S20 [Anaerolineae bacterium]